MNVNDPHESAGRSQQAEGLGGTSIDARNASPQACR